MRVLGVLALLVLGAFPASAQTDHDEVIAVVNRLFEGMRTADTAMVRSTFDPQARLNRAGMNPQSGDPVLSVTPIEQFVVFVGQIQPGQADEPIWDLVVEIDDRLATVWAKYELVFNGAFHHCGVDAFQLWRSADGWKIFQLTDTSRTEDCWHHPDR